MPSATHARIVADRCRKATFEAPGSLVRGTARISISKPALFWDRQRRRAFQVTMSWSKAMTSKWKYRIYEHLNRHDHNGFQRKLMTEFSLRTRRVPGVWPGS